LATRITPFSSQHLEAACRVLADTERGLSGTQIERLLQEIEIADTSPGMTKWKRLFNALAGAQNQHQIGNHLIMFINRAMNPVNYARARRSTGGATTQCRPCLLRFLRARDGKRRQGHDA
jgi:hypothetical protein